MSLTYLAPWQGVLKDRLSAKEINGIISAIKRAFSRSAWARKACKKYESGNKGPRGGKLYFCNSCGKECIRSKMHLDHIVPVVPVTTTAKAMPLNFLIQRLWCDHDNLQLLCIDCHKQKTKEEKKERAAYRKRQREANTNSG